MILFFESYSIAQVLFMFRSIRKANKVYFHNRSFPLLNYNPWLKSAVKAIILFINKKISIVTLSAAGINADNWIANREAVRVVESMTADIENSYIYGAIFNILRDKDIIKCFKMQLLGDISSGLLYEKKAQDIIKEYVTNDVCLAPADNDRFKDKTLKLHIPLSCFAVNKIRRLFSIFYELAAFLFIPVIFISLNFKKISLRPALKRRYDIAMPLIWGFHDGEVLIEKVKWQQDDSYLYCEQIPLGSIIHIFNYWRCPSEVEAKYKKNMEKRGIPYLDQKSYTMGQGFILKCFKIQFQIFMICFKGIIHKGIKYSYMKYGIKIIYWMLNKYLEFENVDYKVELIRHDYSPDHIVDAILCRQNRKRTVGIQHNSVIGPLILNNLCYVQLDKYCVFSDHHFDVYKPFWNNLNFKKTGDPKIDYLYKIANDNLLKDAIKEKIAKVYGVRRYLALILFPDFADYILPDKLEALISALYELKATDIDCNVFIRLRGTIYSNESFLNRIKRLPSEDKRFILDLSNFSTYELMAVSDMVIVSNHSSAMIEAASIDKKAFSLDTMATARYAFSKYGRDLVLDTKEEIMRLFLNLERDFNGFDCDWKSLKNDYNYYNDGKSMERLRQVMLEAAAEASI